MMLRVINVMDQYHPRHFSVGGVSTEEVRLLLGASGCGFFPPITDMIEWYCGSEASDDVLPRRNIIRVRPDTS
jgi:hypothetical protein